MFLPSILNLNLILGIHKVAGENWHCRLSSHIYLHTVACMCALACAHRQKWIKVTRHWVIGDHCCLYQFFQFRDCSMSHTMAVCSHFCFTFKMLTACLIIRYQLQENFNNSLVNSYYIEWHRRQCKQFKNENQRIWCILGRLKKRLAPTYGILNSIVCFLKMIPRRVFIISPWALYVRYCFQ